VPGQAEDAPGLKRFLAKISWPCSPPPYPLPAPQKPSHHPLQLRLFAFAFVTPRCEHRTAPLQKQSTRKKVAATAFCQSEIKIRRKEIRKTRGERGKLQNPRT